MNYDDASKEAQRRADETGFDHGIELIGDERLLGATYRVFMLPAKRNRFGFETRCEVRYCSDLDKCWPGHGPEA